MSTPLTSSPPATSDGTGITVPRRRLRNYLLDTRIQLKFTAYMVAASVAVALLLGAFLVRTTQSLLQEAQEAVDARDSAAQASRELSRATLTGQLLDHMNDPAFVRQLEAEAKTIDARYEQEAEAVKAARSDLVRRQKVTWLALAGALLGFIVVIALVAIVITHRVVGPIFRIRRIVHAVTDGDLQVSLHQLREGDELKELFTDVTGMVGALRETQAEDLALVGRALRRAREAGASPEVVGDLESLAARLKGRVGEASAA
jgi:nitrogen fixation/metabolism regulation signal transduction histidine kinase